MHKTNQPDSKKGDKKKSQFHIPNLGNPDLLQIIAYSDASFANLTDDGWIIFFGRQ